jgi:hypothetical protein
MYLIVDICVENQSELQQIKQKVIKITIVPETVQHLFSSSLFTF